MKKTAILLTVIISSFIFTSTTVYSDSSTFKNKLTVHFIDVGQGDCTLVILPEGKNILVDTGSPLAGPKVTEHLKSLGITRINHLILTHPHDDHIGGILSIVSEFEINYFYDNGFNNFNSIIFGDYLKLVRGNPLKYNVLQAGESLVFDNVKLMVLNPLLPPTGNVNEDSVVLKLTFGNLTILLSGDLGDPGERRLLKLGTELKSQVLKVGHHGDRNSSSKDFLQQVKPETAIINVDEINEYAHPHKETLNRLNNAGATIYRTDRNGHIILKTDGSTYSIHTEK